MNASFSGALLRSLQLFGQMSFSQSLTDFIEYLKLEGITSYLRPGNQSDTPNKLFWVEKLLRVQILFERCLEDSEGQRI